MKKIYFLNNSNTVAALASLFVLTLASCYAGKKTAAKALISEAKQSIEKDTGRQAQISYTMDTKLYDEKIDTTISNRIAAKLAHYKKITDSAMAATAAMEGALANSKAFRQGYKNSIRTNAYSVKEYIADSAIRYHRYEMIKDGLSIADKKLFEMAAFFGPGTYTIPVNKMYLADSMFLPLVDSLIYFSNKYSTIKQVGTMVIDGYADGIRITPDSDLFWQLLKGLKKESATKEELNIQLSQLRAESIGTLMKQIIMNSKSSLKSWQTFSVNSFEYGQGETLPTKTIKDYTDDDDRRRVVLIYWCVLPGDD